MRTVSVAPLLVVLLAACATSGSQRPPAEPASAAVPSAPATPATSSTRATTAAFNPVGTYDFTTDVNGDAVAGTIEISKSSAGALTGSLNAAGMPPSTVSSVTVNGQTMTLVADVGGQAITMTVTMNGNAFTGNWTGAGGSGAIKGTKRTS